MNINNKIKGILQIKGRTQKELADYLGISPQSLTNKFTRGSLLIKDAIKIANFLDCELSFNLSDKEKIILNDVADSKPCDPIVDELFINPDLKEYTNESQPQAKQSSQIIENINDLVDK